MTQSLADQLKEVARLARKEAGTEGGTVCICPEGHWAFACPVHQDPFSRRDEWLAMAAPLGTQ